MLPNLPPNWRHPPFAACEQRGSLNRSISPPPHSGTVTEGTLARPPGLPVSWAARMVAGSTPARAHRFGADLAVGEQIGTAVVAQTAVVGRACALPQLGRCRASTLRCLRTTQIVESINLAPAPQWNDHGRDPHQGMRAPTTRAVPGFLHQQWRQGPGSCNLDRACACRPTGGIHPSLLALTRSWNRTHAFQYL